MTRIRLGLLISVLTMLAALGAAASASANYHLIQITEIYKGTDLDGDNSFIELQMYADGQNQLTGHKLTAYDDGGAPTDFTFTINPASGNQRTVLLTNGASTNGVPGDYDMAPVMLVMNDPQAICFDTVDCVAFGGYNNTSPSPYGTPISGTGLGGGLAPGDSITRKLTRGCRTALDPADDTNNSAADFKLGSTPTPRRNATTPTERTCAPCRGQAGTIGGSNGPDVIVGTPGRDVISGKGGADRIRGLGGNDVICGGGGNDRLSGNAGNDTIDGQAGKDRAFGNGGRDRLFGGGGRDFLFGGGGKDFCKGGPGKDRLRSC